MLSTAIIRCTSGNGGFAFINSLSITTLFDIEQFANVSMLVVKVNY